MAKPIFVIKVNKIFPLEQGKNIKEKIEKALEGEYHVLVANCLDRDEPIFECYNAKDETYVDIEELKKIVQGK